MVTHLFNGMGALAHRAPGLPGAALDDERLTPGLIADFVHVQPALLRLAANTKDCVLVTDAVAVTVSPGADGFGLVLTVVVVSAASVNVTCARDLLSEAVR